MKSLEHLQDRMNIIACIIQDSGFPVLKIEWQGSYRLVLLPETKIPTREAAILTQGHQFDCTIYPNSFHLTQIKHIYVQILSTRISIWDDQSIEDITFILKGLCIQTIRQIKATFEGEKYES